MQCPEGDNQLARRLLKIKEKHCHVFSCWHYCLSATILEKNIHFWKHLITIVFSSLIQCGNKLLCLIVEVFVLKLTRHDLTDYEMRRSALFAVVVVIVKREGESEIVAMIGCYET